MNKNYSIKLIFLFSALAIISAWLTIIISIHFNPWFSVTKNALSDLGGGNLINNNHPAPLYPYIYNYGMIITGILLFLFSSMIIINSRNKIEINGLSFFMISGLFLALIGIYHEGTYPHDFVSIWFFILASISYFSIGISLIINKFLRGYIIIIKLVNFGVKRIYAIPGDSLNPIIDAVRRNKDIEYVQVRHENNIFNFRNNICNCTIIRWLCKDIG